MAVFLIDVKIDSAGLSAAASLDFFSETRFGEEIFHVHRHALRLRPGVLDVGEDLPDVRDESVDGIG
jgi:hypothetical protein